MKCPRKSNSPRGIERIWIPYLAFPAQRVQGNLIPQGELKEMLDVVHAGGSAMSKEI